MRDGRAGGTKTRRTCLGLLATAVALGLCACGRREPTPRTYIEDAPAPAAPPAETVPSGPAPAADAPAGAPAPAGLAWTCPAGWEERPASGMRLASFAVRHDTNEYECSITVLPGAAGGLPANVMRWAGQIGLEIDPGRLRAFVDELQERRTAAGDPLSIVDFTRLTPAPPGDPPLMLAAMIRRPSDRVFVKLTAPRAAIEAHRAGFESLCLSLRTAPAP